MASSLTHNENEYMIQNIWGSYSPVSSFLHSRLISGLIVSLPPPGETTKNGAMSHQDNYTVLIFGVSITLDPENVQMALASLWHTGIRW